MAIPLLACLVRALIVVRRNTGAQPPTRALPTTDSKFQRDKKRGIVTTDAFHIRFTLDQSCLLLTCNLRNLRKLLLFL
jgi:hypothetical protein